MKFSKLALSALSLIALAASAVAQSITDTTDETNTQQQLATSNPAELTESAWDFTGQGGLASIGFLEITLTLQDGDSAVGEFDFDQLFLALDGVNTGIALNGFRGGGLEDTLTISGSISPATSTALLAEFDDEMFVGTIVTQNPADTALTPNDIFVGNDPLNATTTLTLSVPEPATLALIGAGLLFVLAPQVRRFRRNL